MMECYLNEIFSNILRGSGLIHLKIIKIIYLFSHRKEFINYILNKNLVNPIFNLLKNSSEQNLIYIIITLTNFSIFPEFRNYMDSVKNVLPITISNLRNPDCKLKTLFIFFINNFTLSKIGKNKIIQENKRHEGLHVKRLIILLKFYSYERQTRLTEILCNLSQSYKGQKLIKRDLQMVVNKLFWTRTTYIRGTLSLIRNICLSKYIFLNLKKINLGLIFILITLLTPSLKNFTNENQLKVVLPILKNIKREKIGCTNKNLVSIILDVFKYLIHSKIERIYVRKLGIFYVLLQ